MWHPERRIGGLSHCLLPQRETRGCVAPDGRFVDEALLWLIREELAAMSERQRSLKLTLERLAERLDIRGAKKEESCVTSR